MKFASKSKLSFTEKYTDISDNDPNFITIDWYNSINGFQIMNLKYRNGRLYEYVCVN